MNITTANFSIKFINICHRERKFHKKFLFIQSFFIVGVDSNDMQSRGKMGYKNWNFSKAKIIKTGAKRAIKKWGEREILFFI